ncbi:hypothetical protein HN695_06445 [Candidatus Woesearchaeota archaeon]|jgi:hypothetical protein|nr:hypothetical protein [Candidatus Woesearchaeota archaeon]MBT7927946.1 hypothetical protein [Candidatus Woesearchaeota archaeon]
MRIHEGVFIALGLIVIITTLFVEHLLFFRYIGGLILLYGTFKLIFRIITGHSSKKEVMQSFPGQQPNMQNVQQKQQKQNQSNTQKQQTTQQQSRYISRKQIFKCNCGNDIFPQNHFCSNCGLKLK